MALPSHPETTIGTRINTKSESHLLMNRIGKILHQPLHGHWLQTVISEERFIPLVPANKMILCTPTSHHLPRQKVNLLLLVAIRVICSECFGLNCDALVMRKHEEEILVCAGVNLLECLEERLFERFK